jgi:hypothetical protein
MNEKDLEKSLNEFHNTDLSFTQEDREKVFHKIEEEQRRKQPTSFQAFRHRAAPLMAMAVLLTLSVVLAYSLIGGESIRNADRSDDQAAMEQSRYSSLLMLLANEDDRTDVNLLITYDNRKGSINMTSLPREMAVPFKGTDGIEEGNKNLTSVFAYGNGGEAVRKSLSKALNLPVDYYVAVKSDEFKTLLNTMGETVFNLDESKILLSLDGKQITMEKGPNYLDGNKAVALLSAHSTSNEPPNDWNEQDRLDLAEEVLRNLLTHLPPTRANALLEGAETNGDLTKIFAELAGTKLNSMETVSIREELEPVTINKEYFLQFKEGAEERIKEELLSFE